MKKVLVVGASGYLGGWIVKELLDSGWSVVAALRRRPDDPEKLLSRCEDVLEGDICDEQYRRHLAHVDCQHVVYAVSLNHHDSAKSFSNAVSTNVVPLLDILERVAARSNLKRIVYLSTMQVYGVIKNNEILSETRQVQPANVYGFTHRWCEEALAHSRRVTHTDTISLRISNGFGPPIYPSNDCWWLVIQDFCSAAVKMGEIRLSSDGSPLRDFLHVTNIAAVVRSVLEEEHRVPPVINVGSGNTLTMLELAHLTAEVCEASLGPIPVILNDGSVSKSATIHHSLPRFRLDCTRMSELTSLDTKTLREGVRELVSYLLMNHH